MLCEANYVHQALGTNYKELLLSCIVLCARPASLIIPAYIKLFFTMIMALGTNYKELLLSCIVLCARPASLIIPAYIKLFFTMIMECNICILLNLSNK